ncbi:hypothetical protein [Georgenia sp. AZ-5]|uniref:hypothetical protein n=1 Tax=Georgenia sp. AZ-5 TaxID=3367526 RepID=UPI003753F800
MRRTLAVYLAGIAATLGSTFAIVSAADAAPPDRSKWVFVCHRSGESEQFKVLHLPPEAAAAHAKHPHDGCGGK